MELVAKVLSKENVSIPGSYDGMVIDGEKITLYEVVFLLGQTTTSEIGPYRMNENGKLKPALTSSDGALELRIERGTHAGNVYGVNGLEVFSASETSGDGIRAPRIPGNYSTTTDVSLSSDSSTAVLSVTISGLGNSKKYLLTLRISIWQYTTADHAVGGSVDITIDASIATSSSGVATVTFKTSPSPDVSRLPSALSGATATVAASTGGFTVSTTRATGVGSKASCDCWINKFKDVT